MKISFFLQLASLTFILISISCTPPKSSTDQTGKTETWHGHWQWEETRYVRRGGETVVTPKDAGVEMEIAFLSNGELKVYHNKELKKTYNYKVNKTPEETFLEMTYNKEEIDPNVETGILRCTGNKLEILGGYNDAGGNQTYRRIE